MPTPNVHVTEHFDMFIAAGIKSGQFSSASEVVREGLRLLEQRQQENKAKIRWLCGAAQEGINAMERGEYVSLRSSRRLLAICAGSIARDEASGIRGIACRDSRHPLR